MMKLEVLQVHRATTNGLKELGLLAKMAQQAALDDAMVIIQEASAAISHVSSKLNSLEGHNQEVVAALKDLSNKVANLESRQGDRAAELRVRAAKAPLFIRVSTIIILQ